MPSAKILLVLPTIVPPLMPTPGFMPQPARMPARTTVDDNQAKALVFTAAFLLGGGRGPEDVLVKRLTFG
ncbi:hypothetical protein D3C87_1900910 [compost metagenome]